MERSKLDTYLSRSLGVPLVNNRLEPIDDSNYVLTLDFTMKMLNIHERQKCGIPVIIEGETGVGKTALIEMMSKLWNYEHEESLKGLKIAFIEEIQKGMICEVKSNKLPNMMDLAKI